ncbi:hypothetical protein K1Y78_55120, partial [Streptomyces sp. tea 10]|nr:hypothetical protein [Streptomyces sp. tea 10]
MHRSLVPAAAITVGFGLFTAGPAAAAAPAVNTGSAVQVPMGGHDRSPAPGTHPHEGKANTQGHRVREHRGDHGAHHDRHRRHGKKHRPG